MYSRFEFLAWYGTDDPWQTTESDTRAQATPPAVSVLPQPSSAAQAVCAAPRLSEESRARKFLKALEEAAYQREDERFLAMRLRELINSLYSGKLLNLWHVDEERREDVAIAKLDQLIELVVSIRTAWTASLESENTREVAGRCLGPLEGDMSDRESQAAARDLFMSMSREKRAEYDFCFQASGSKRFFFALLRQPSFLKAEDLQKLLEHWAIIINSSEYKEAMDHIKKRLEPQISQKAELQNLRMQINRLRKQGQDAKNLLLELRDKEKRYESKKMLALGPTPLPSPPPRSAHNPVRRSASARRALVSRVPSDDIPPKPSRVPPLVFNWTHEITPEFDVDWTLCPEDWGMELRLREVRNEMLKEQLQLGRPVIYRSSGWSLHPRVWSNDRCTFEPVTSADEVKEDDIVFCQVQPGDRFYGHIVSRKWFEHGEWYFTISNLKGRENGWCSITHIYGRLIRCEH